MFKWLSDLFLKVQIKQVQKISVSPDEQLMIVFKTDSIDYQDISRVKQIIGNHLPSVADRVIILASPYDVDVKAVAISEYLRKLKQ